jgi:hypothetical protein
MDLMSRVFYAYIVLFQCFPYPHDKTTLSVFVVVNIHGMGSWVSFYFLHSYAVSAGWIIPYYYLNPKFLYLFNIHGFSPFI